MRFIAEVYNYLKTRKKFWLLPILIILGTFGALLYFTSGTVVAPFIYTIF